MSAETIPIAASDAIRERTLASCALGHRRDIVLTDETIRVLDHGFVRLDGVMASDLSVVNGARVSFARRKDEMDDSDAGLIRFLMRERHGTPFEHNAFRFHIRCPIFVAREWMRHRVGSFNEFSLRYAKATEDFYVPEPEDVRTQVGKPGAYVVRDGRARARGRDARRAAGGRTSTRTRRTSGSSTPESRARLREASCRSAPTPSSTGRSTHARS